MNKAVELLADEYGTHFEEFTVCGIPYEGFFAHEWYIGVDSIEMTENADAIREKLDMTLKVLNDDYRTERSAALKEIIVHPIPREYFYEWLRKQGKEGAQSKFPRVLKKELQVDWKEFIQSKF